MNIDAFSNSVSSSKLIIPSYKKSFVIEILKGIDSYICELIGIHDVLLSLMIDSAP